MDNINLLKRELFESTKIVKLLESLSPLTVQGHTFKQTYLKGAASKNFNTLRTLNSIIVESARISKTDDAVLDFYEAVNDVISKNIFKYNLGLLHEVLNESNSKTRVQEMLQKELNNLVAESEETVVSKLQHGALNVYENISAVNSICNEARKLINSADTVVESSEYSVYHPISYVYYEDGQAYIQAKNNVFSVSESGISLSKSPNRAFNAIATFVESLQFDRVEESFVISDAILGDLEITENKLFKKNSNNIYEEVDTADYANKISVILESKARNRVDAIAAKSISEMADGIIMVANNFKNIVEVQEISIIDNKRTNESFMIGAKNNIFYCAVLESRKRAKEFVAFNRITEAIEYIKKASGYDITERFIKEVKAEASVDAKTSLAIREQNNLIAELNKRLSAVNEDLSLVERGSDAYNILKDLKSNIVGAIVEQNNVLKSIINK